MSARAKAMANLYRRKKITKDGLQQAVADGVLAAAEYEEITGEVYAAE